jgi:hypothetical protein
MKLTTLIALGVLFLLPLCIQAQSNFDSLKTAYNSRSIIFNKGIRINDEIISKHNLLMKMNTYEAPSFYYNQYLKAKKPATIFPLAGLAFILSGALLSRENNTAGTILISSSVVFTITGSLFVRKANNYLNLAVWHYNREVLFSQR